MSAGGGVGERLALLAGGALALALVQLLQANLKGSSSDDDSQRTTARNGKVDIRHVVSTSTTHLSPYSVLVLCTYKNNLLFIPSVTPEGRLRVSIRSVLGYVRPAWRAFFRLLWTWSSADLTQRYTNTDESTPPEVICSPLRI